MNTEGLAIRVDPETFGGKPYIEGRRITVQQVAEYHTHFGWNAEKIAWEFDLSLSQVYAALSYYHAHKSEIDADILQQENKVSHLPNTQSLLDGALDLVMTPQEISESFGITTDAVYQAVRRGRLTTRKSGKTLLILRRDAQALWGQP